MPTPHIAVDCTELTDDELNEVTDFLADIAAVDDVSLSFVDFTDIDDDEPISISASAEPIVLMVNFLSNHWKAITAGTHGVYATAKAAQWLIEQINKWTEKRREGETITPIYDANDEIVSLVKVSRKKH